MSPGGDDHRGNAVVEIIVNLGIALIVDRDRARCIRVDQVGTDVLGIGEIARNRVPQTLSAGITDIEKIHIRIAPGEAPHHRTAIVAVE